MTPRFHHGNDSAPSVGLSTNEEILAVAAPSPVICVILPRSPDAPGSERKATQKCTGRTVRVYRSSEPWCWRNLVPFAVAFIVSSVHRRGVTFRQSHERHTLLASEQARRRSS